MPACATTDGGGTMTVKGGGFEPGTTVTFDGIIATVRVIDVEHAQHRHPGGRSGLVAHHDHQPGCACSGGRSRPLRH